MIRKCLRSLSSPLKMGVFKPNFMFSYQAAAQNLKKVVESEIEEEQRNPEDISKATQYLQQSGWSINYNDIQIQLAKDFAAHRVYVLSNAKTRIQNVDQFKDDRFYEQKDEESGQQKQEQDFCRMAVIFSNKKSQKGMVAEYIVTAKGHFMHRLVFAQNVHEQIKRRATGTLELCEGYQGPQVINLQRKMYQTLSLMALEYRIDQLLFRNLYQLSISYEQKFYIQWLKDVRNIL